MEIILAFSNVSKLKTYIYLIKKNCRIPYFFLSNCSERVTDLQKSNFNLKRDLKNIYKVPLVDEAACIMHLSLERI